jgi:hypothetical protein
MEIKENEMYADNGTQDGKTFWETGLKSQNDVNSMETYYT